MSQCQRGRIMNFPLWGLWLPDLFVLAPKDRTRFASHCQSGQTVLLNNTPTGICLSLLGFKKIKRENKERSCLEVLTGLATKTLNVCPVVKKGYPVVFSHGDICSINTARSQIQFIISARLYVYLCLFMWWRPSCLSKYANQCFLILISLSMLSPFFLIGQ